ncbi:MAG: hypothetical protein MR298_01865 [Odoribacter sp.]|nr:hypothetical protein [Odoribacter sp.]
MNNPSLKNNSMLQHNDNGDNAVTYEGNIYIDKSIHVYLSKKERDKTNSSADVVDPDYVIKVEAENKKLLEDNRRLRDIVLDLQKKIIEFLNSEIYFKH